MGEAHFIGERTAEVKLNAGKTWVVSGENIVLSLGTVPPHLVVIGGVYVGREFRPGYA